MAIVKNLKKEHEYKIKKNYDYLKNLSPEKSMDIILKIKKLNEIAEIDELKSFSISIFISLLDGIGGTIKINDKLDTYFNKERVIKTIKSFINSNNAFNKENFWKYFEYYNKITLFNFQDFKNHNFINIISIPLHSKGNTKGYIYIFGSKYDKLGNEIISYISILSEFMYLRFNELEEKEKLTNMALKDSLTSLYNRRYFMEIVQKNISYTRRYQKNSALIMMDIDFFKKINDIYGHQTGDYVLRTISEILMKEFRSSDIIGRYGGEEFIIYLPETTIEKAVRVANRVREKIVNYDFKYNRFKFKVTVSMGIASINEGDILEKLISLADKRLYIAKQTGRNRVISNPIHLPVG